MLNNAYDKDLDYNYLTQENNAKVVLLSSETKGCSASNILSTDRKAIWLSESSIPQHLVIDLGNLLKKPKSNFKYFGIYCWHAYSTNPKVIELQFSKDSPKGNLISFGKYEIALKPGTQFFEIRNNKLLDSKFKYMKVIIKETHGGNRTYLNQIYLFDELSGAGINNASTMNSFKVTQNSNRKENLKVNVSESLFDGEREEEKDDEDVEEVPLREPSAIERSYLVNLNDDGANDDQMEVENKYINFDMDEEIDDESFSKNHEASRHSNKMKEFNKDHRRVKKIENILKSKGKEKKESFDNEEFEDDNRGGNIYNRGNVQNYLSSQESNNYIEKNTDNKISNKVRTKSENFLSKMISNSNANANAPSKNKNTTKSSHNKEKLNKTFTYETSNTKNNPMNEYQQLENQLKDMEEHLKSMEADIKIDDYKYNSSNNITNVITRNPGNYNTITVTGNTLSHSKSLGYIPIHLKDNYNLNNLNTITCNNLNKDTGLNFGVSSGTYITNPFINRKENYEINTNNQGDLLNNYLEFDNDVNKNNSFTPNASLEAKIHNIEDKLGKFEGELKEMKNSFNKLMDNINKLVESGIINSGNNNHANVNNPGVYNTIPQNNSKNLNSNFDSINVAGLGLNTHNTNNTVNNSAIGMNLNNNNNCNSDMINLILSECSKMINEKLMMNSNTNMNMNTNSNISSAKKRENYRNTAKSRDRERGTINHDQEDNVNVNIPHNRENYIQNDSFEESIKNFNIFKKF
jgi:hypothetical protein